MHARILRVDLNAHLALSAMTDGSGMHVNVDLFWQKQWTASQSKYLGSNELNPLIWDASKAKRTRYKTRFWLYFARG
jgi:hypothetical protein